MTSENLWLWELTSELFQNNKNITLIGTAATQTNSNFALIAYKTLQIPSRRLLGSYRAKNLKG